MKPIYRNILAVVIGIVVGVIVNLGIISLSGSLVPLPEGMNFEDPDSLKANLSRLSMSHYLFPILAHALGTLVGSYATARFAATHQRNLALLIGIFFLIGGVANWKMIPAPTWVIITDLFLAYLPMSWLGFRLSSYQS